jgi:hypothetical protein
MTKQENNIKEINSKEQLIYNSPISIHMEGALA